MTPILLAALAIGLSLRLGAVNLAAPALAFVITVARPFEATVEPRVASAEELARGRARTPKRDDPMRPDAVWSFLHDRTNSGRDLENTPRFAVGQNVRARLERLERLANLDPGAVVPTAADASVPQAPPKSPVTDTDDVEPAEPPAADDGSRGARAAPEPASSPGEVPDTERGVAEEPRRSASPSVSSPP